MWKCLNYSTAGEQQCHSHVEGCKSWVMFKVCQAAIQNWAGSGSKNGSEGFRHSVCAGFPCWALAALYLYRTTHAQSLGQALVCSGRATGATGAHGCCSPDSPTQLGRISQALRAARVTLLSLRPSPVSPRVCWGLLSVTGIQQHKEVLIS